jgi:fimbrial chaperone protein
VKSGAFSVINGGNEKLNVQISAKEWSQDAEGKDVYEETKDLVFFPKIMTVEPNEQRAIRIGVKAPAALQEKTFRLFVEEIPSPKKDSDMKPAGKITAGLTIAFRFSTPIFVKPVQPKETGIIETIGMSAGSVRATIKNSGNVHFKVLTVTFSGKAIDGKELLSKEVAGWYVLHGKSRPFEVVVPQEFCESLATIKVEAKAENFTIDGTLNVQKKMCSH